MTVYDSNGRVLQQLQPCGYPTYKRSTPDPVFATTGWISSAEQTIPRDGSFTWSEVEAEVSVPATPNDTNATIAYFTGLAPGNRSNNILQACVFWGDPAYGNSPNSWSLLADSQYANSPDEIQSNITAVPSGDPVELGVLLLGITAADTCDWNMTDSGWQWVCGYQWAWIIEARDPNSGATESIGVLQASDGQDTPPNGVLYPYAYPAVYESHGDTSCELGAVFSNISLWDNSTSTVSYNSVAYKPALGPNGGGMSSCGDNSVLVDNDTETWVF